MKYRWLHISDIHSICVGIKTKIMRKAFLDEIKEQNQANPFSFMIITGDLSNKNEGYEEAKDFILEVINKINLSIDNVFIVPGNHDVNRCIPDDREIIAKKGWCLNLLDDKESEFIKSLLPGQSIYFKIYEEILNREYPKDEVHFSIDLDDNISIVHFNTAWMCYDSSEESGKLHIGLARAYKCLSSDSLKDKPIKIAIGHHRIDDLQNTVANNLKSLFKTEDVDLYLGGHCHSSAVVYDPQINTEFCSCRQSRAEECDYPAGYIIGEIDTESDQSSFQFYNWNIDLARWTYDYTVQPAKHGKYYLQGRKFTHVNTSDRDVIIDLKMMGIPLDYKGLIEQFSLNNPVIYRTSLQGVKPQNFNEWRACISEVKNLYNDLVQGSTKEIHIFPIAWIPLLVSFGYLAQNDNPNLKIYQYYENESKWVYDEENDDFMVLTSCNTVNSDILALTLNISTNIDKNDIDEVLDFEYDLLSISIPDPVLSKLNYYGDVQKVKAETKKALDRIANKYKEIHMFLAAPAGVCIEIGRIIRESMYPDTFIYNYSSSDSPKYSKVINLKEIQSIKQLDY